MAPTAADPLAELRDWHLPEPVSWWPPAPGWWLLTGLALAVLLFMLVWWWRRRRQGAAERAALDELGALRAQLGAQLGRGLDAQSFAAAVSVLLRRLALRRFPRERVAGLSGAAWAAFLDETGGGGGFSSGPGLLLGDLPYREPSTRSGAAQDLGALADLAERWIRANHGDNR